MGKMQKITVTIPEEDLIWLRDHKEINVSGLVQSCIKDLRKKYD